MQNLITPVSQRVYFPAGAYTTLLAVANTLYATPFIPGAAGFTPDQIGVNVTTAGVGANADVRLGIYSDAGGRPGSLLVDAGAITGLTAIQAYTASLAPGLKPYLWGGNVYWLTALFNTAATTMPTCAAVDTVAHNPIGAQMGVAAMGNLPSSAATAPVAAVTASQAYGALPATFPAATVVLNAKAIIVGLRHA